LSLVPQLWPALRQYQGDQRLSHYGDEPPHDGIPGGHPAQPGAEARSRDGQAHRKCRLPDLAHHDGATRAAYHLYPFRYQKEHFNGLPRSRFLAALSAEGIPCSGGYGPQYHDGLIEAALNSKNFKRAFPKERLDRYREELHYPGNDQLCQEAVWFTQNMLLGPRSDIDDIANAIVKVYENRDELAKSQKA
jgi:hypothetical protein